MDLLNELLSDQRLFNLERDLSAVRLNDCHFTDAEKQRGLERLERQLKAHDRHHQWYRLAAAAVFVAGLLTVGTLMWQSHVGSRDEKAAEARIEPRHLDMVLTTTDGHALNLSEGGQLVCSELGYLTIKGMGQTLVCTPSAANSKPQATEDGKMCELRVPEGKRTQIELSDGSRVWVNSATTIRFPLKFEAGERRISVDGEVYLEVAHKSGSTFAVETDSLTVTVLGTKFGVQAYSGKGTARVVLAEGRVAVSRPSGERYELQPDQMLTLADGEATLSDTEAYTYTSWKDGLLYFNGTTLGEALAWLSKQYAVDINCSPESAWMKLYGKLILEERVENVLDNLTVIEPISYEIRNNQVFVEERERK